MNEQIYYKELVSYENNSKKQPEIKHLVCNYMVHSQEWKTTSTITAEQRLTKIPLNPILIFL